MRNIILTLMMVAALVAAVWHPGAYPGENPAVSRDSMVVSPRLPAVDEHAEARELERQARESEHHRSIDRANRLHRAALAAVAASRSEHRTETGLDSEASAWANSPYAIRVANCESGGGPNDTSPTYDGNPSLNDPNGHYGKWQFDFDTWASVGGSGNPANFSEAYQDLLAYRLYLERGWQPWQCASLVQ